MEYFNPNPVKAEPIKAEPAKSTLLANPANAGTDGLPDTNILCCECGTLITPNPANMCVACLRTHVDITEHVPKQAVLYFCRSCERYLHPPSEWVMCTLESRELLSICLKKLKGLKDLKLIDAGFIWTEPHSRRLKVKLTVHKEVFGGTMLQQVFVVEFIVNNQMCDDCHRSEAKDYWTCLVQVRQRAENKKTFYYLEQLMLKHRAHENTLGIKPEHGGLDFYYATENHARKLVDFLSTMLPVKLTESKRLISQDIHSNTFNCKFTYSVDLAPLSKDSLVCLPKKVAQQMGGMAQIVLVNRVAAAIHLIDPQTAQIAEMSAMVYYRSTFDAICNPQQLTEYVVMDMEIVRDNELTVFPGQGAISQKHVIADVWLVKAAELGINENAVHARTHLGHLLKVGDSAMGYNLVDANVNNDEFDKLNKDKVPDVVLVKKHYGDASGRRNARNWKLRHLNEEQTNLDKGHRDYNQFLEDLEEDPQLRQNVNIFKDQARQQAQQQQQPSMPVDVDDMLDPSVPRITLEEMLDDLLLDDDEMGEEC